MLPHQFVNWSNEQGAGLWVIEQPEQGRFGLACASGERVHHHVVVGQGSNGIELVLQRPGQHLADTGRDCLGGSQTLIFSAKTDTDRLCHLYVLLRPLPRVGVSAAGRPKAMPTGKRTLSKSYIRPES